MTYYDDISLGYEELHREEQEKKLAIVKKYISITNKTKLLDVGCGTGITSKFNCDVTGLDPAKKLLDKNPTLKKVCAKAENMPFKDNSFDIVISITAIQNFDDVKKGLKEIKRVGRNQFALTFLKKSSKRKNIEKQIESLFTIQEKIEEEKDIIYIAKK